MRYPILALSQNRTKPLDLKTSGVEVVIVGVVVAGAVFRDLELLQVGLELHRGFGLGVPENQFPDSQFGVTRTGDLENNTVTCIDRTNRAERRSIGQVNFLSLTTALDKLIILLQFSFHNMEPNR